MSALSQHINYTNMPVFILSTYVLVLELILLMLRQNQTTDPNTE